MNDLKRRFIDEKKYVPALKYNGLTPLYGQLVPLIPQYRRFEDQLTRQAMLQPNQRVK